MARISNLMVTMTLKFIDLIALIVGTSLLLFLTYRYYNLYYESVDGGMCEDIECFDNGPKICIISTSIAFFHLMH